MGTQSTQTVKPFKFGTKKGATTSFRALAIRMEEQGGSDLLFAGQATIVAYICLRRLFTDRETKVREPAITRISRQSHASFLVTVSYKKASAVAGHANLVRQFAGAAVSGNDQQHIEVVNVREGQPMLSALVFASEIQATIQAGKGAIEWTIGRNNLIGTVTKAPEDQAAIELWTEVNGKQFDAALLQVDVTLNAHEVEVAHEAPAEAVTQ